MTEKSGIPPLAAAIHDLSCFGRCALTVILPTLSALGVQGVPLPTALLSSHTGGFDDLYFRDLTEDMEAISAHFGRLGLSFDAIYSGFLGSAEQIGKVSAFIDRFRREGTLVLVDPVMGDDGSLYSTYTPELMKGMKELCCRADVITPNYTEACFLTGTPYLPTQGMREKEVSSICNRLLSALGTFGTKYTVITGVACCDEILTVGTDADGEIFTHRTHRLSVGYPGTGDIFASVLLGLMLRKRGFCEAVDAAADFTALTIRRTMPQKTPVRNGVALESCIRELVALTDKTE